MAVKIRLQRKGRKQAPFYHIVIADSRAPRDGKFIERIGSYNPMTKPATIDIDRDKAYEWLVKGAQPTDTVRAILKFKGVLLRKHLMRGVAKGAFTQDKADELYNSWLNTKESNTAQRVAKTIQEKKDFHASVLGQKKAKPVQEAAPVVEEETPVTEETPVVEETAAVEEAPAVVEETPVVEAATPVEEAPVVEATAPVEEAPVAEITEEAPAAVAEEPATEEAPAVAEATEEAPQAEETTQTEEAPASEEENKEEA